MTDSNDSKIRPDQRSTALLTTAEAARATGLSAYELRAGWKAGKYPALAIGNGGNRPRLRWRLDLLEKAIAEAMQQQEKADEVAILSGWQQRRTAAGR